MIVVYLLLGLSYLVWINHLSPIFISVVRLIDRVGKVPKEKLCIQDVGMSDQCITKFIGLCEYFFEIIIKVVFNNSILVSFNYY